MGHMIPETLVPMVPLLGVSGIQQAGLAAIGNGITARRRCPGFQGIVEMEEHQLIRLPEFRNPTAALPLDAEKIQDCLRGL